MSTNTKLAEALRRLIGASMVAMTDQELATGETMSAWEDANEALAAHDAEQAAMLAAAAPAPQAQAAGQELPPGDFICEDHDSPWLICKPCAADGKCARAADRAAHESLAALASQPAAGVALTREQIRSIESPPDPDTVDRAIWTDVRMELEAAGRDDLSQFVWIATKSNGRA